MKIEALKLPGVLLLTPARHGDARGFFSESWNRKTLRETGVDLPEFVQDNHSLSHKAGTLRGLHYQAPPFAQGKLVRCGRGALFDVAVDARRGSPTYGEWVGVELSYENGQQLWVPPGFLHGFVTKEPDTEIIYKCTAHYDRVSDGGVLWNSLGIDWGLDDPVLSEKDEKLPEFENWASPFEFGAF
ncbi:dTDP-4-dehydrorhamnose 3,5-epimerase [Paracoccus fistulariae]|uniref:dTDP-4-dehydrorhamnose 3,5-epimerase n=1 Tax=Paracoccus fistulariae TaxID=658446 RepID=A0ABY7SHG7_9RHOB|nr:dTDP-4-dehydrorhamnose 3,5-epimerase [Paracoccus fistulariae]MDB6181165.1 dTDP-4-dehydrorhamnose 3,5-epimerase [Paracoccus fistulariae]WCR06451.1 dTDP-4-dehydrorhamnose 3,5-epimerase [Paracoccus fistulariae]